MMLEENDDDVSSITSFTLEEEDDVNYYHLTTSGDEDEIELDETDKVCAPSKQNKVKQPFSVQFTDKETEEGNAILEQMFGTLLIPNTCPNDIPLGLQTCIKNGLIELCRLRGYTHLREMGIKIIVLPENVKFNTHLFEVCVSYFSELIKHIIVVYDMGITPASLRLIQNYTFLNSVQLELFSQRQLSATTLHYLTPCHQLVTCPKTLKELARLGRKNLPRMLQNDAVARWYGFKAGDMIQITRKSGEVTFRLVV